MRLTELLTPERIAVFRPDGKGDAPPLTKSGAIRRLAELLGPGARLDVAHVERVLTERESVASTGIGEGVAIPHGALSELDSQFAALLIVPAGLDFNAIDGQKVSILFAVIGPKRSPGEHLKILARVSRLLRNMAFRERLLGTASGAAAYTLIEGEEEARA